MGSLRVRLLGLVTLLLVVSFGGLIVVLDQSFRAALEQAQRDLLDSQIITLLAVAEPAADGTLAIPNDLPEQRLTSPGSGLYAQIRNQSGESVWQSRSSLAIDLQPQLPLPEPGAREFVEQTNARGEVLQALTLGIIWEFSDTRSEYFALTVSESRRSLQAQLVRYRGKMFIAFGLIAALMLISMTALLGYLLRPLGRIESEIEAVEAGEREQLSAGYPSELAGVSRNLNTLLLSERTRAERYRETLANLAHSLKTPLAAAQNLLDPGADSAPVRAQLERMQSIVRYQLARPAAAGGRLIGNTSVAVAKEALALLDGLDKVYLSKQVTAELDIEEDVYFHGDKGDLIEILGNLLDNAYKWCGERVLISAQGEPPTAEQKWPGLVCHVDDDGPGVPAEEFEMVLQRGTRLDESTPGTGIGLAVVRDLVKVYDGELSITTSPLGGARITLRIPPH